MAKISRFEELVAWQQGRALAAAVYRETLSARFRRDFSMQHQLRNAASSIHANLAEGFERYTLRDFHRFICIAKASCAEVRSRLYGALDMEYIHEDTLNRLLAQAEATSRTIGKLRSAVQKQIQLRTRDSGLRTRRNSR